MNTSGTDPGGASVILKAGGVSSKNSPIVGSELNKTRGIPLRKNQHYYIELSRGTHDTGGLWLGWSRDAKAVEPDEIIPNRYLIPFGRPMFYLPVDDVAKTTPDKSLIIDVLSNDLDYRFMDESNNECIEVSFVGQVANGKTEIIRGRQIKYTPKAGFKGTDKFQYAIQCKSFRERMRVGSVTVNVSDK
jgi:hypothetical protein